MHIMFVYFPKAHLRLKLAASPDATLSKDNQFGDGFDIKVKEWKDDTARFYRGG